MNCAQFMQGSTGASLTVALKTTGVDGKTGPMVLSEVTKVVVRIQDPEAVVTDLDGSVSDSDAGEITVGPLGSMLTKLGEFKFQVSITLPTGDLWFRTSTFEVLPALPAPTP